MLDRIVKLEPVYFNWKSKKYPEYGFGAEKSFGLIAQQVEKEFPDWVARDEHGNMAVHYSKIPLALIQAMKELNEKNAALENRLQKIEKQRKGEMVTAGFSVGSLLLIMMALLLCERKGKRSL